MRTNLNYNTQLAKIIFLLFVILTFYSFTTEAQSHRSPFYRGMEISFGMRRYKIQSNFDAINDLTVKLDGGRAGVIVGNEKVKLRAGAGFYYSSKCMMQTFELVQMDFGANFYLIRGTRFAPYLTAGAAYGKNKFYGYYANKDAGQINYSSTEMPRIGCSKVLRATVGAGMDFKLVDQYNFVHLFSEMRYGISALQGTSDAVLNGTTTSNQLTISVGVRFGAYR